jgi:glycerophosphoryl diester phosphodiesterase
MQQYRLDLDAHYQWATKENIDRMHALGIKVNVWTVDDPAVAEQLADWGIDYITSNILE